MEAFAHFTLPIMTVFGKVARLNPGRNKENRRGYRVTPITIFGKAQKNNRHSVSQTSPTGAVNT
jgi:hypothetical protein